MRILPGDCILSPSPLQRIRMLSKLMARTLTAIFGAGVILVGLIGFVIPHFFGTHLSLMHNLVHLISGVVALYGVLAGARSFCFVFGMFYGLLGMLGFIAGRTMALLIPGVEVAVTDSHLLAIIPDTLILSTNDHVLHIVLSLVFLLAGLLLKPGTSPAATLKSYEPCVME
jgi:hypothetical protein